MIGDELVSITIQDLAWALMALQVVERRTVDQNDLKLLRSSIGHVTAALECLGWSPEDAAADYLDDEFREGGAA